MNKQEIPEEESFEKLKVEMAELRQKNEELQKISAKWEKAISKKANDLVLGKGLSWSDAAKQAEQLLLKD